MAHYEDDPPYNDPKFNVARRLYDKKGGKGKGYDFSALYPQREELSAQVQKHNREKLSLGRIVEGVEAKRPRFRVLDTGVEHHAHLRNGFSKYTSRQHGTHSAGTAPLVSNNKKSVFSSSSLGRVVPVKDSNPAQTPRVVSTGSVGGGCFGDKIYGLLDLYDQRKQ